MSGHTIILNSASARQRAKVCAHCGETFYRDARNTWAYWERAKYCGAACSGAARTAQAIANRRPMREEFERWFSESAGCWEWQGAIDRDGYGIFSYAGKTRRAARVALELDDRAPATAEYACHNCDNPRCVRPDHLYPGTHRQNEDDKLARQRQVKGSAHYATRLTDADVVAIRASQESAPVLAARYGVSRSNITMIRLRRTWRHIP